VTWRRRAPSVISPEQLSGQAFGVVFTLAAPKKELAQPPASRSQISAPTRQKTTVQRDENSETCMAHSRGLAHFSARAGRWVPRQVACVPSTNSKSFGRTCRTDCSQPHHRITRNRRSHIAPSHPLGIAAAHPDTSGRRSRPGNPPPFGTGGDAPSGAGSTASAGIGPIAFLHARCA